jgi:hypothetical protein
LRIRPTGDASWPSRSTRAAALTLTGTAGGSPELRSNRVYTRDHQRRRHGGTADSAAETTFVDTRLAEDGLKRAQTAQVGGSTQIPSRRTNISGAGVSSRT